MKPKIKWRVCAFEIFPPPMSPKVPFFLLSTTATGFSTCAPPSQKSFFFRKCSIVLVFIENLFVVLTEKVKQRNFALFSCFVVSTHGEKRDKLLIF